MFSFFVGITLAVHLGPIFPDARAGAPQMAADGSTIVLAFGAGKGIYFNASGDSGSPRKKRIPAIP